MRTSVQAYKPIAMHWSRQTGVPAGLILAVIEQESGGNPAAIRFESDYLRRYVFGNKRNLKIAHECGLTPEQMATSYGLMQLMFPLAYGYGAHSIADLLDANKNIRFGTAHLCVLLKKNDGDIRKAAGAYNGAGDGSSYARNVEALAGGYERWVTNG